ncbi:MAG: replicative DNA helicase [Oscillospiraceae bacterium]|nr:replicative DNA helicase [Oscillospiraceae bacterium]
MDFDEIAGREMPHSTEAEQTVLGAVLLDPGLLSAALEHLKADSFYIPRHKQLFSILERFSVTGVQTDIITVLDEAVKEGVFEESSEGKEYLAGIMEGVPTLANIESYCKIVEEKYYLRTLAEAARVILQNAVESAEPAEVVLDAAEQMIYDIRQGREVNGLVRADEVLLETYDRLNRISGADKDKYLGAKTGYSGLDKVINGLNKSDLIILAARPAMGKSSFALNIAANVCRRDPSKDVVIFSLEMSNEQLITRMLAAESLVENDRLLKGDIGEREWEKLAAGSDRIASMSLYLDDSAGITAVQMKAKLRRVKNLGLVIVDHLQLMNSGRRTENRVTEMSEITRQLKLMAKDLNVPVIALSQLSRAVDSRPDKRPLLSDLRESGSIEQDADIVMFLYRDGYYNKESSEDINLAECIVAKNRHGETGTINLRWNGQYTLFISEDRRSEGMAV